MKFIDHFLKYAITPLFILLVGASYVRFIFLNDYVVSYEGVCDPYSYTCFVGCNDEECNDVYYYDRVKKYAPYVQAQCGFDITDCAQAQLCLSEDGGTCEVTYCTENVDSCENLEEGDRPLDDGNNVPI